MAAGGIVGAIGVALERADAAGGIVGARGVGVGLFIVTEKFLALRKIVRRAGVNCGSPCRRRVPSMVGFGRPHRGSIEKSR